MKLLLLLSAITFATSSISYANEIDDPSSSETIYTSNVLDDLNKDSSFDALDYNGLEFGFIRTYEFAYSPTSSTYFNLISYFYINPSDVYSPTNTSGKYSYDTLYLQMSLNGGEYSKFDLRLLSYDSGYFKVSLKDPESMYISSLKVRAYSISGLTIQTNENADKASNEKEFTVATKYTYSGYAVAMNGNSVSSLTCNEEATTVIELHPQVGAWLSESSGGIRTVVYYSYFNIPNNISDAYGELYEIHYDYKLVQLKTMYALPEDLYDYYVANVGYRTYVRYQHSHTDTKSVVFPSSVSDGEWQWDSVAGWEDIRANKNLVFFTENDLDEISHSEIEARYASEGDNIVLNSQEFDITTKNENNKIYIRENNLNDFERWWEQWSHGVSYTDKAYNDVNTWDIINSSTFANKTSEELEDELLVKSSDLDNIKKNYLKSGQTTYLFRYENREYYSEEIKGYVVSNDDAVDELIDYFDSKNDKYYYRSDSIIAYKTLNNGWDLTGYYFDMYGTVDFDIISFTFNKNGELTIIPVVQDPVSNFPDAKAPDTNEPWGSIKNFNWKALLFGILAIAGLIIAVFIFFKYMYPSIRMSRAIEKSGKNDSNKRRRR